MSDPELAPGHAADCPGHAADPAPGPTPAPAPAPVSRKAAPRSPVPRSTARRPPVSRRTALRLLSGAVAVAASAAGAAVPAAHARGGGRPAGVSRPSSPRVEELLARLTLDEKIALVHGATDPAPLGQAGYVPGVPRLGVPPLRLADGPAGVRVARPATALPAPVLLASAFDPDLARRYGEVIGREGRALGLDVLLSPMANLIRTPYGGRNFETLSEDPLLSADLVAAEIEGVQAAGLIATVKHFALNNQETDRMSVDVRIDERTLHECELRAFEAAVAAGAGAVMGAYNKVNGVHACENAELLTSVLRERWGFDGWVMSDWDATHSAAPALRAGLDMEMPGGVHYGAPLRRAVADGTVPEALLDRSVRRLLGVMDRFGLLGADAPRRPERDPASGAAVAREVAEAGATLLRNERGTLPLAGGGTLAVIGPTAAHPFVSGGGSAHVVPDRVRAPLDALRERAAEVTYAVGEDLYGRPIPADALSPALRTEGHRVAPGERWTWEGTLRVTRTEEWTLVLHWTGTPPDRPKVQLDGEELYPPRPASPSGPRAGSPRSRPTG